MSDRLTYTCAKFLEHLDDQEWHEIPHWVDPCHVKSLLRREYVEIRARTITGIQMRFTQSGSSTTKSRDTSWRTITLLSRSAVEMDIKELAGG